MKKIINCIRRKMIHWLGGVTQKESSMVSYEMANEWQYRRVRLIRSYLELLNGTDTDTCARLHTPTSSDWSVNAVRSATKMCLRE